VTEALVSHRGELSIPSAGAALGVPKLSAYCWMRPKECVAAQKRVPSLRAVLRSEMSELRALGSAIRDLVHAECRNEGSHFWKERKRRKVQHDKAELELRIRVEEREESLSPQNILESGERRERIESAIASLPKRLREVAIQRFLERRKVAAIAAGLQIGRRAVRRRIRKSLSLLEEELGRAGREMGES
jgi:RNA polymerase sigma factor (sigma-70 family)